MWISQISALRIMKKTKVTIYDPEQLGEAIYS